MAKCQLCKRDEAIWAMQYIGEDTPTFTTLGSHYRGFRVTKVCDDCKEIKEAQPMAQEMLRQFLGTVAAWRNEYDAEERAEAARRGVEL